jgi:hypothetical protein
MRLELSLTPVGNPDEGAVCAFIEERLTLASDEEIAVTVREMHFRLRSSLQRSLAAEPSPQLQLPLDEATSG